MSTYCEPDGVGAEVSDDEYRGAATISAGDRIVAVQIHVRGYFEPIDGRYHWYGRVRPDPAVDALASSRQPEVVVRTPSGQAHARLGDPDLWQRYRLTGVGPPPFTPDPGYS